jgi:hypothetical protein
LSRGIRVRWVSRRTKEDWSAIRCGRLQKRWLGRTDLREDVVLALLLSTKQTDKQTGLVVGIGRVDASNDPDAEQTITLKLDVDERTGWDILLVQGLVVAFEVLER